jgi:hypothetical protein
LLFGWLFFYFILGSAWIKRWLPDFKGPACPRGHRVFWGFSKIEPHQQTKNTAKDSNSLFKTLSKRFPVGRAAELPSLAKRKNFAGGSRHPNPQSAF